MGALTVAEFAGGGPQLVQYLGIQTVLMTAAAVNDRIQTVIQLTQVILQVPQQEQPRGGHGSVTLNVDLLELLT